MRTTLFGMLKCHSVGTTTCRVDLAGNSHPHIMLLSPWNSPLFSGECNWSIRSVPGDTWLRHCSDVLLWHNVVWRSRPPVRIMTQNPFTLKGGKSCCVIPNTGHHNSTKSRTSVAGMTRKSQSLHLQFHGEFIARLLFSNCQYAKIHKRIPSEVSPAWL